MGPGSSRITAGKGGASLDHCLRAGKSGFDVRVFGGSDEMCAYLLVSWQSIFRDAVERRGLFTVALSGGETPRDFYRRLSGIGNPMWNNTHIFLVDERFVPFTHSESNFGMLNDLLLSGVDIRDKNCHPIPVEESSPERSAKKYEQEIRQFFGLRESELPEFDLILLGIGEDGHTASLFPGDDAVDDAMHLAQAVFHGSSRCGRITLTLPVLNNARNVMFLVMGEKKSRVLRKVIENDDSLPASRVRPKGTLTFVVDQQAASGLRPDSRRRRKIRPGTAS